MQLVEHSTGDSKTRVFPGKARNSFPGLLVLVCLSACVSGPADDNTLFSRVMDSGIDFQNTVIDSKDENSFLFRNFYNGGGVALADINNDGLCDVFLTSNLGDNKLYLNKGNLKFDDITAGAGFRQEGMWSTGAVMADVNNDGWLDIYVCSSGRISDSNRRNKLYINNKDLTFTESAREFGLDHSGYCTQASFFDYDMDGDLDCLLINNSPFPFSSLSYAGMRDVDMSNWKVDEKLKGGGNHLFRNDNGKYTEVTKEAGLHTGLISFGLGVSIGDINGDHFPDIYVGNDFIERDYMYINQQNGTFRDELEDRVRQVSMSSMSSDIGDINNDGFPDIFTTDMIPDDDYRLKTTGTFDNVELYLSKQKAGLYHQYVKNCLQLNNGNGQFSEIANYAGVYGTDWSWGALFLDADNDGLTDIFVCNGINRDLGNLDFLDYFSSDVYQQMLKTGSNNSVDEMLKHIPVTPLPNRVFRNTGQLRFIDKGSEWGFAEPTFSNSLAYADLDNDGDLDLVINNENQPAFVYKNNSRDVNHHHFIGITLEGNAKNTFAVGSKIKVYKGDQVYFREIAPSRGFQASVDYRQVIGIGTNSSVDSIVIIWPDRTVQRLQTPGIDTFHVVRQSKSSGQTEAAPFLPAVFLSQLPVTMDRHQEDDHIDFYHERNLPEMLSREGPAIAVADVNGDGLEDIYIGGAKATPGQLYLQDESGFRKKEQELFRSFQDFEDVTAIFFDADKDGDQDLFLGSGGNAIQPGSRELQHRLYLNDGKGHFTVASRAFPANDANISVAVAGDFDADGNVDLFVGGRSVPYQYGVSPRSYIYRNNGSGQFIDVTGKVAPELVSPGMITDALWTDLDGDGQNELIITGEWMTTRIFNFNKQAGKFEEWKDTGLEKMSGWWQQLAVADMDGDGRTDLIAGNIGENFYLRPDAANPVKLWLNDFDGNGIREQFITRTVNGKDMPVFLKRDISDQFPSLKKQNLQHNEYAVKSIQDLFGNDIVDKSLQREFNFTSSVIAYYAGNRKFSIQALPVTAQLSNIRAICIADIDNDGRPDLLTGGNSSAFPPQFGRLDASYGHLFLNKGNKALLAIGAERSGLAIIGEVKHIRYIKGRNRRFIFIARNNDQPALYEIKEPKSR